VANAASPAPPKDRFEAPRSCPWPASIEWVSEVGLGSRGCKTPSEYMFSELPQVADIARTAFHYSASPLVLRITAFWVRAIQR
jgi:hypothetical protein